jgi:hypothetical protein
MRITSKPEFYQLAKAGCLGNLLRLFNSADEARASNVQHFGFRQVGAAGGGRHGVYPRKLLSDAVATWNDLGCPYIIDEAAPDIDVILQGEICRTTRGWEGLLGIRTGHRMRESIALGLLVPRQGIIVRALLREFLDASSLDDVDELLELYPDATIELASYPYDLGRIPNRNTLIWEVRDY